LVEHRTERRGMASTTAFITDVTVAADLFDRASDGKPWTKSGYRNWRSKAPREGKDGVKRRPRCFKAAAEDLGLGSSLRPYDLRHTFATLAANAGWTADEIVHQLGNGTDVVNKVYRHMLDAAPRPEQERQSIDDSICQARDATSTPVKKPIPA
jgi:integrase